ncbi:LLM class flavin-dependent oxidoreductase [Noviherbaspirillum sedimenti]|uniref:LLM class flavin-dependent oxidoreductase n=1 Tax=Noviherbaspirillum sedimenti TaxID=2320865 RepID=UPI0018F3FC30
MNLLSSRYYANLAQILEAAKFDMLFLPDILAIPQRFKGSMASQLEYGALGALRLDPMIVLATIAASTRHLGLAATISTSYFEPFAVARALATAGPSERWPRRVEHRDFVSASRGGKLRFDRSTVAG